MLLETKSKFDIRSISKDRPFTSDNFYSWSNNHMYRTSYTDMGIKVSFDFLIELDTIRK